MISYSPTALWNDQVESFNPEMETPTGCRAISVWADPVSLATTQGIDVSFFSSGYLDVSVRRLTSTHPMCSGGGTRALPRVGFPIRRSPDQRLVSSSPGHIAAAHVLHRLQMPRHPPCALCLLIQVENHSRPLWSFQGACGSLRRLKARKPAALARRATGLPVSQSSTARSALPRENQAPESTFSRRVPGPDGASAITAGTARGGVVPPHP
jgi:hypothetical protein